MMFLGRSNREVYKKFIAPTLTDADANRNVCVTVSGTGSRIVMLMDDIFNTLKTKHDLISTVYLLLAHPVIEKTRKCNYI